MNPPEPTAALVAAIDDTVKTYGWWAALALIPLAATVVVVRGLSATLPPPPEAVWRRNGLAMWHEFEKVNGG